MRRTGNGKEFCKALNNCEDDSLVQRHWCFRSALVVCRVIFKYIILICKMRTAGTGLRSLQVCGGDRKLQIANRECRGPTPHPSRALAGHPVAKQDGCFLTAQSITNRKSQIRNRQSTIENRQSSHLEDYRQNHGPLAGLFVEVLAEAGANFFLDHTPITDFFEIGFFDSLQDDLAGAFHQVRGFLERHKPARDDFRLDFELAGVFVDGQDGDDDAVGGDVTPLFENDLLDLIERAHVDAHAAHRYAARPPGALLIELEERRRFLSRSPLRRPPRALWPVPGDGRVAGTRREWE